MQPVESQSSPRRPGLVGEAPERHRVQREDEEDADDAKGPRLVHDESFSMPRITACVIAAVLPVPLMSPVRERGSPSAAVIARDMERAAATASGRLRSWPSHSISMRVDSIIA